jgi:hypothetical protein
MYPPEAITADDSDGRSDLLVGRKIHPYIRPQEPRGSNLLMV